MLARDDDMLMPGPELRLPPPAYRARRSIRHNTMRVVQFEGTSIFQRARAREHEAFTSEAPYFSSCRLFISAPHRHLFAFNAFAPASFTY